MKFGEKVYGTKLLSRLSHKVCRLLSFPVLLHKVTNEGNGKWQIFVNASRLDLDLMFSGYQHLCHRSK